MVFQTILFFILHSSLFFLLALFEPLVLLLIKCLLCEQKENKFFFCYYFCHGKIFDSSIWSVFSSHNLLFHSRLLRFILKVGVLLFKAFFYFFVLRVRSLQKSFFLPIQEIFRRFVFHLR